MAPLRWLFGASALAASALGADLVKVRVYGESGCPYTMRFLEGELNETLGLPGFSEVVEFEYVPWGNSYFVTKECDGAGRYNRTARRCYNTVCGEHVEHAAPDCFSGAAVCQHGMPECIGNKYQACAKVVTNTIASLYMPFMTCVQVGFLWSTNASEWQALGSSCAASSGLDFAAITACFEGEAGDAEIVASAKATPEHPGVPWVLVEGKPVDMDSGETLLKAVCAAYAGDSPPEVCSKEATKPVALKAKALRGAVSQCV